MALPGLFREVSYRTACRLADCDPTRSRTHIPKVWRPACTGLVPVRFNDDFLGRNVLGVKIPKICGLDIDDLEDFGVMDAILSSSSPVADDDVWRPSVPPYKG